MMIDNTESSKPNDIEIEGAVGEEVESVKEQKSHHQKEVIDPVFEKKEKAHKKAKKSVAKSLFDSFGGENLDDAQPIPDKDEAPPSNM